MQAAIFCTSDPETMTEKRVEIYILERLEAEQKDLVARVDTVNTSLGNLSREVSELRGSLPGETPAWIRFFVFPACVLISAGMVAAVISLLIDVHSIKTFINENGGFVAGLRLEHNVSNPADPQNTMRARQILNTALAKKIKIPEEFVVRTGGKFIEVAAKNPAVWPTVQQFLDYRSFLNADFVPPIGQLTPLQTGNYPFSLKLIPRLNRGGTNVLAARVFFAGGYTAPENSARLESLSKPTSEHTGVGLIVVEGKADTIGLDDEYMKNVIVRNATVAYSGGPVVLQNVYFINCTFEKFEPTPRSRDLGNALLASASVNFDTVAQADLQSEERLSFPSFAWIVATNPF